MTRRQKEPLRPFTADERGMLERVRRASSERAARVARAKALRAVAEGASYTAAAMVAGRRSQDGVAHLVARCNRLGRAALDGRHGGGPLLRYGSAERERILREVCRPPDREQDGTATWSLTTLRRALRRAPDGLATVSTWTILQTLREAGYSFQQDRPTGPPLVPQRHRHPQAQGGVGGAEHRPGEHPPQELIERASQVGQARGRACRSGARMKPGRTRPSPGVLRPGNRTDIRLACRTNRAAAVPPSC